MPLPRRRPLLCLVTDRKRLAAWPGSETTRIVDVVRGAARGGVDLIHVRERDLPARDLLALIERCLEAARGTGALIIVNDRVDAAIASGAHGVHLRGDSADAARVRAITPPGFLVGRSVHGEAEAVAAARGADLDYLVLGPLFETRSKPPGHPRVGLDALSRLARRVDVPVLAIGGITHQRLPAVLRSGAAGVAAIGLFLGERNRPLDEAAEDAVRWARAAAAARGAGRSGKLNERS